MATKTLTITEEAYGRLATAKENHESFSDFIVRRFPSHSLLELAGTLTNNDAQEIRVHIARSREGSRKRLDRIAQAFR